MYFHAISAYSETSPSAAISAAVAEASADYSRDAKSVHLIVSSVFEINGGWKAVVRVVVEPDLEEELEEYLESKEVHFEANKEKEKKDEEEEDFDYYELEEMTPDLYVYFPMLYEEAYVDFRVSEPEVYTHLIENEAIWEKLDDYFLDIKFYEATHQQDLANTKIVGGGISFDNTMHEPDFKPKEKKLRHGLDLEFDS